MLIAQDASAPMTVRDAIVDLIGDATNDSTIAVAYTTSGGVALLLDALRAALGETRFDQIPKALITSLDYGITEPAALEEWQALPNSSVEIAGVDRLNAGSLIPSRAFHPKVYSFGIDNNLCNVLVGSANLTARAFSINAEAVWAEVRVPRAHVDNALSTLRRGVTVLTNELLTAYAQLRRRQPPPPQIALEAERVSRPPPTRVAGIPVFRDAVESGAINPQMHRAMWIQVERLQGGSRSQLELPRGAHRFFDFAFGGYAAPNKVTIGELELRNGRNSWPNKLLTWHGNNQMERINLPTVSKGGFDYENSAILFRRIGTGVYELVVEPWDSDLSRSWRQASADTGRLFRLGGRSLTSRVVGLLI